MSERGATFLLKAGLSAPEDSIRLPADDGAGKVLSLPIIIAPPVGRVHTTGRMPRGIRADYFMQ